jgi:hypothetical protein
MNSVHATDAGGMHINFTAALWKWSGGAAWHFVSLPKDLSDDIAHIYKDTRSGFGSIRVSASIGDITWATSIFPDSKSGCFLLPIKKSVRLRAGIIEGDAVSVSIVL